MVKTISPQSYMVKTYPFLSLYVDHHHFQHIFVLFLNLSINLIVFKNFYLHKGSYACVF